MHVPMQMLVCACGLLLLVAAVFAQSMGDMVVRRIVVEGATRDKVEGALQISLSRPDGKESHTLAVGEVLAPGTRVGTGASVLVEIARASPAISIVLEPRTRVTVPVNTANATQVDVAGGKATFSLIGRLDFYFGVAAFRKVFAIAKGTTFSVETSQTCAKGNTAGCVTVSLDEGRLELETHRPVVLTGAGPANPSPIASTDKPGTGEDDTVSVVDGLAAGQSRTFDLDPASFALRFETIAQADQYFAAELGRARAQKDPAVLMRAIRNLLVIRRMNDRHADALALASEGLQLAKSMKDRVWEFRFMIDQAFSVWKLKRDRSALPFFQQAFAMKDVIDTLGTSADLAELYARYGGILFEARNREQPEADLNASEDYSRRALRLREPRGSDMPSLDLSWSHYSLGVFLRIARGNYLEADRHFGQALAIRQKILGNRDDIGTAEMLADAALTKEMLVRERSKGNTVESDALVPEFDQVRQIFEESLAMLKRLSPDANHRSLGAIARRMADFQRRLGEWWLARNSPSAAVAELRAARVRYQEALDVFARIGGNTAAERRFAYRGLGQTEALLDEPAGAIKAFDQALAIARQERCATPPSPEAPSTEWVTELLQMAAEAAARSGGTSEAAYRQMLEKSKEALSCQVAATPVSTPASRSP